MHALLDAVDFVPAWVECALLLALSMRLFESESQESVLGWYPITGY